MAEPTQTPATIRQARRSMAPPPPASASASAGLTLAYMAAALVGLAFAAAGDARYILLTSIHLLLGGALLVALRHDGAAARTARAWLPLLAIPVLYAELPYLMAATGATFGDAVVQRWELALWGGHPARSLAAAAPAWWVSEPLHLAYLSYYALIYVPLAYLWVRALRLAGGAGSEVDLRYGAGAGGFAEASLGVMATFIVCFVTFVVFPVQGPRFLWEPPPGIAHGPIRSAVLAILEQGSSRGAAFPSSHMAVAVVQALMAFRWEVPGRWAIAGLTIGLGVGAVYGGFHYGIDMVAGTLVGGAAFLAIRARRHRASVSG